MGTNVNCHIPLPIWMMADVPDVIKYLNKCSYTSHIKIEFVFIRNLTLLFQLKFCYTSYEQVLLCRRIKVWASLQILQFLQVTVHVRSDLTNCLLASTNWKLIVSYPRGVNCRQSMLISYVDMIVTAKFLIAQTCKHVLQGHKLCPLASWSRPTESVHYFLLSSQS
jgi:hypothetical protein